MRYTAASGSVLSEHAEKWKRNHAQERDKPNRESGPGILTAQEAKQGPGEKCDHESSGDRVE
jgi:hypothetical protein